MKKAIIAVIILISFVAVTFGQVGIRAGINMANRIQSFSWNEISGSFSKNNLTGFQIGVVQQFMNRRRIFGCEFAALFSQKGYTFDYQDNIKGYSEINFVEIPFNLRVNLPLGIVSVFGYGGAYGAYALNGKTVIETDPQSVEKFEYQRFYDHLDYGYSIGAGLEFFRKLQLSGAWQQGLKNTSADNKSMNRVLSVTLTYLF